MAKVKNAITKPKFSNIFASRFVIFFIIFMFVAVLTLQWLDNRIYTSRVSPAYREKIERSAELLYKAKSEGADYEKRLDELKLAIAIYQMVEDNYAEVHIKGEEPVTVSDTAVALIDGNGRRFFFIEDISYLKPVNEYMNGKFNLKEYNLWESQKQYELVYLFAYNTLGFNAREYLLKDLYINWETYTFIPGKMLIKDSGKEYEVDCTPKDTKGYEHVEAGYSSFSFVSCYRTAPEKTAADIDSYIIPDENGRPEYIPPMYSWDRDEVLKTKDWYVGLKESEREIPVYKLCPVTCICVIVFDLLAAVVVTLIISFVKYQKDKTIWNIFEYRTKTTEAMAHDLKTPMAAIAAYAESMESFAGDAEKTTEYSRKISEKIESMDHMVEDILALSRSESGKIDIKAEEVNVMALVTESLEAFPGLKTNISGSQVKIKTDRKLFKQAIDNLLSNCDRYGEEGSAVDIEINSSALSISNKTNEKYADVESLKKPFVKGSDSRSDKGTGLGLSIADNNLNILGYKLELSSEEGLFKAKVRF